MSSLQTTYYASTAALEIVTIPSTTMTTISRLASTHSNTTPAETHTNTPAPEFSKPLSPTAIGLMCSLGSCGILGFVIWAVIYFRTQPNGVVVSVPTEEGQTGYGDEGNNMNGEKGKKGGRSNAERGVLLHNTSGITTARPSTEGELYLSVGIVVNTAPKREILDILEAETAIRAMSRMSARA